MEWCQTLDSALFRLINQTMSHPFLDQLMPFLSWNKFFVPSLAVGAIGLAVWGKCRGQLCLFFLVLTLVTGELFAVRSLKKYFHRPRPFQTLTETKLRVGKTESASMPSGHTLNWFAASVVAGCFFRRSWWWMLPLASLVGLSRIYNGVHYPSDVLAGAGIGLCYAAALLWGLNRLWQSAGPRWFPLWWSAMPSLLKPEMAPAEAKPRAIDPADLGEHWFRLGGTLIVLLLAIRWWYLGSGTIELSEDEAYQWLWSKHLALSYFSKPPLIAYAHFLGTSAWGDTIFGIRFFAPLIAAVLAWSWMRFLTREVNPQTGFAFFLAVTATPLLAVGATLMTIDSLSVLFWSFALLAGWTALQQDAARPWIWVGFWTGLGFLSKYAALFQLVCWAGFFLLWQPARRHLRQPGPYLALLVAGLLTFPVLAWNHEHQWITLTHLANRGGLDRAWQFSPRFFWDFTGAEFGLLNPVFFLGTIWAVFQVWRCRRDHPLLMYLWCMGVPLVAFYWLYTLRARVLPNWVAPSVLPLLALMVVYWRQNGVKSRPTIRRCWYGGLWLGLAAIVILHDTNLLVKVIGRPLPPSLDPLRRVRAWSALAEVVEEERAKLMAEGKAVFIIGDHYGTTSLMTFYLPEARKNVTTAPWVYYRSSEQPQNQFYFWPGYRHRRGQSALYVQQVPVKQEPPESLRKEFGSVTDLGTRDILYRGRVLHRIQLFACRNLL